MNPVLKGLGLKPSRKTRNLSAASAAEVVGVAEQLFFSKLETPLSALRECLQILWKRCLLIGSNPQRLKPPKLMAFAARLKPGPFKT